jgi:hypothetical protein
VNAIIGSEGCLTATELAEVEAFNLKVDTCLLANVYKKLPQALKALVNLPSLFKLQQQVTKLSGFEPVQYNCCKDVCCCFTGQYEALDKCHE